MYAAVSLQDVILRYNGAAALSRCSLQVTSGETYGLLGPAGSGKTTLLQVVLGLLVPQSGRVQVLGAVPHRTVRRIGYLPAERAYLTHMTAAAYLWNFARVAGMSAAQATERSRAALELLELTDLADQPLSEAGPFQLQAFGLAQAVLDDPDLIVLDDPLRWTDGSAAAELVRRLQLIRRRGRTTLITARATTGLDRLCDRVGVLSHGALLCETDMQGLRGSALTVSLRTAPLSLDLQRTLRYLSPALQVTAQEITLTDNTAELQARVLRALLDANVTIHTLQPLETQLDCYYREALQRGPSAADGGEGADQGQALLTSLLVPPAAEDDER